MCALCSVVPCHDSNPAESRRLARRTTAPRISSARATHARSWSSADRLALPSGESLCRATASCSRRAAASQLTARQRCTACVSRCRRSRARLARCLRRNPADAFHALTALDCARPRGDILRSATCARCRRSRATVHAACHPRQPAPSLRKHMADSARRAIAYLRPKGRQVLTALERGPASTARALPSSRRNLADRALATARHRRSACASSHRTSDAARRRRSRRRLACALHCPNALASIWRAKRASPARSGPRSASPAAHALKGLSSGEAIRHSARSVSASASRRSATKEAHALRARRCSRLQSPPKALSMMIRRVVADIQVTIALDRARCSMRFADCTGSGGGASTHEFHARERDVLRKVPTASAMPASMPRRCSVWATH
mmetsp:Transcript_10327/g.30801  ORF Transcript_10327/g.30801 Transcript_10327/m.30801 type:complete len:381 (-) Transcript_10327:1987-3129(-)